MAQPHQDKYIKGQKDVGGYTMFPPMLPQVQWASLPRPTTTACLASHGYAAEFGVAYRPDDSFKILAKANYIALWIEQTKDVWGG